MSYVHNAGFSCVFFETGICFWERKGMYMKNRRYVSLVVVFVMMLAIGLTGMVSAEDLQEDGAGDHLISEGVARMSCTKCYGDLTYLRCTGVQVYSHTNTHNTGFLGIGGETCTRTWHQSTLHHVCMSCGNIVSTEFGHYCLINHSICADESWCVGGGIA